MPDDADLWKRLVLEAGEDAVETAAKVSVSEADRDLQAAGFDTNAERAKAAAAIADLAGAGTVAKEDREVGREGDGWTRAAAAAATRKRASSRVVWLVAALTVAAAAGSILYVFGRRPKPPEMPPEPPRPTPTASAAPLPAPEPSAPLRPAPREGDIPFRKMPVAPRGAPP
jgi:hypothetical protein